jgi:hypothetical protein
MIGKVVSHYKILEKLGEVRPASGGTSRLHLGGDEPRPRETGRGPRPNSTRRAST